MKKYNQIIDEKRESLEGWDFDIEQLKKQNVEHIVTPGNKKKLTNVVPIQTLLMWHLCFEVWFSRSLWT